MKGGKKPQHGFTIVETMIVLAVAGIIFLIAVYFIQGRVSQTEFTQSVQDFQSTIQTNIANTSNGFYTDFSGKQCIAGPGSPVGGPLDFINPTAGNPGTKGTNLGCIFMGKVFQFYLGQNLSKYAVYTIVGRRLVGDPGTPEVTSLSQAQPLLLASGFSSHLQFPNTGQNHFFSNGVTLSSPGPPKNINQGMYFNGTATNYIGAFAVIGNLAQYDPSNQTILSGPPLASLYEIPNSDIASLNSLTPPKNAPTQVDYLDNSAQLGSAVPVNSVQICLNSGTTQQSALVTIGAGNGTTISTSNPLTVSLTVKDTLDCA